MTDEPWADQGCPLLNPRTNDPANNGINKDFSWWASKNACSIRVLGLLAPSSHRRPMTAPTDDVPTVVGRTGEGLLMAYRSTRPVKTQKACTTGTPAFAGHLIGQRLVGPRCAPHGSFGKGYRPFDGHLPASPP
jgi:hypothetical protein